MKALAWLGGLPGVIGPAARKAVTPGRVVAALAFAVLLLGLLSQAGASRGMRGDLCGWTRARVTALSRDKPAPPQMAELKSDARLGTELGCF